MLVEQLDQLGEVGERSGEAVDLVDYDSVDTTRLNVREQLLQSGPIHRAAREPPVASGPGAAAVAAGAAGRHVADHVDMVERPGGQRG